MENASKDVHKIQTTQRQCIYNYSRARQPHPSVDQHGQINLNLNKKPEAPQLLQRHHIICGYINEETISVLSNQSRRTRRATVIEAEQNPQ